MTAHQGAQLMGKVQPQAAIVHPSLYQVVREYGSLLDIKLVHDLIIPDQVELPTTEAQCDTNSLAITFFTSYKRIDAGDMLDMEQRHKITQSVITLDNLVTLINKDSCVKQYDLSALELMAAVTAPLSAVMQKRAMEFSIMRLPAERPGPVGWLLPGIDALLLDLETREPLAINKNGPTGPRELVVRSPSVFSKSSGYLQRPVVKAAFITINGQSYIHLGDVVIMHADGCLAVVDRRKHSLVASGRQCSPTWSRQALTKTITASIAHEVAPYKHLTGGIVFADEILRNAMVRSFLIFTGGL
ncbi:hypothetical protein GGF31_007884 [Allomyces arbusculus]|nr:hypothetical protein GGF31_007884 [Allomyces arbusculus]